MEQKSNDKKKIPPLSTKESFISIGKGLFSNQAVIDSRRLPWYWALLVFLLDFAIVWIPSLSKGYTSDPASFLTSAGNSGLDSGFKTAYHEAYFQNITIQDNKAFSFGDLDSYSDLDAHAVENRWNFAGAEGKSLSKGTYADTGANYSGISGVSKTSGLSYDFYLDVIASKQNPIDSQTSSSSSATSSSSVVYEDTGYTTYLEIYVIPELVQENNDQFTTYRNNFLNYVILNRDPSNTTSTATGRFPHSSLILGKDNLTLVVYPLRSAKTNSALASYAGYVPDGFAKMPAESGQKLVDFLGVTEKTSDDAAAYQKMESLFGHAARQSQILATWQNVGIISAIMGGAILVGAIILLIMEKRKTSVVKTTVFGAFAQSINLMLVGAILSMALGFMNATYSFMVIVATVLLRIMWMANRITPPPTADDKPLYQARS